MKYLTLICMVLAFQFSKAAEKAAEVDYSAIIEVMQESRGTLAEAYLNNDYLFAQAANQSAPSANLVNGGLAPGFLPWTVDRRSDIGGKILDLQDITAKMSGQ